MLRQVCAFCGRKLDALPQKDGRPDRISHGVCPSCFPAWVAGSGQPFAAFLDSLPAPVLVLDQEMRVVAVNEKARQLTPDVGKNLRGSLPGEAFGCAHAHTPEGCGRTVHCQTCAIRRTVERTAATGEPQIRIPAYADIEDMLGLRIVRFLISTEKVGESILLRIDAVDPEDGNKS